MELFGVTCTCSWLELFVVIWSWVKNDAAPFLGVGGLVGGYAIPANRSSQSSNHKTLIEHFVKMPSIKAETKFRKIKVDVLSFQPMIGTLNKALCV